MKEIGEIFKEKREEIGITTDEVSSDLNIDKVLIENLEIGNDKVFKDILEIQDVISIYQKYLDIEELNLVEKFNDYLFEKTSKISISDIKERLEQNETKEEKKIKSPYTAFEENKASKENKKVFFLVILLFLLVVLYVVLKKVIIG